MAEDGSVTIAVLTNDVTGPANESGQTLTVTAASALHGTVAIHGDGTLTYAPNANYNGPDTISYTITDDGTTNGAADPLTASSTVAVTVTEVNNAPSPHPTPPPWPRTAPSRSACWPTTSPVRPTKAARHSRHGRLRPARHRHDPR